MCTNEKAKGQVKIMSLIKTRVKLRIVIKWL